MRLPNWRAPLHRNLILVGILIRFSLFDCLEKIWGASEIPMLLLAFLGFPGSFLFSVVLANNTNDVFDFLSGGAETVKRVLDRER